jgi:hypothetical protein
VESFPAISPAAAEISDSPMIVMTLPVTTGGKNLMIDENGTAISSPKIPDAIIEP